MKLRALDLFCCAGGATRGLQAAGFHVTGVDIKDQPNYCGDEFHVANAMEFPLTGYDFVWASPPCQTYMRMNRGLLKAQGRQKNHPDLVDAVRRRLQQTNALYVIENVVGSPLRNPVMLCGSSFGLLVERHRLFEANFLLLGLACRHETQKVEFPPLARLQGNRSRVVGCYGNGRGKGDNVDLWRKAMGISWMSRKELAQAIPPAYAEYIGQQAIAAMSHRGQMPEVAA
ncbi:DNA cytosine methyltransferase [Terriglobus sp. RCC_193]|uniref:DNA cytosine methyltransferase n=1 Tax=Terriglobus sp. RCC_193 TaxID=3239218 RepID=UPI003525E5A8